MALSGLLLSPMAASAVATATFGDMGDRYFAGEVVVFSEGYGAADRQDDFLDWRRLFDCVSSTDADDGDADSGYRSRRAKNTDEGLNSQGSMILEFTDFGLVADGDLNTFDLAMFEIGKLAEAVKVKIREDAPFAPTEIQPGECSTAR